MIVANLTNRDSLRSVTKRGDIVVNAAGYANASGFTQRGKALLAGVGVDSRPSPLADSARLIAAWYQTEPGRGV